MPLTPGTRLGPYEIAGPLGAGGMGEVYQARDSRLDRTVAIKILPEHLAADPYYQGLENALMAAEVRTEGTFDVGTSHPLFKAQFRSTTGRNYDATPDGQRFQVNGPRENDRSGQSVTLVLNWLAALRK